MTTALLSMTGPPSTSALQNLVVPRAEAAFRPAGAFGRVYERYKCYVCHKFNGFGGTLAPDLSYEGSRAQRQWLISFLKNPQTLRPTLVLRMPQFNMTDQEAADPRRLHRLGAAESRGRSLAGRRQTIHAGKRGAGETAL